jgi:SsrA-binding protein
MPEKQVGRKIIARNKKAFHEYHIVDSWEAGIVLLGPEVKSIRAGRVNLQDAFARVQGSEVWLHGMHVSPYDPASRWNVEPDRPRKLLLHRGQIRRLIGATQEKGLTLVLLDLYLQNGKIKSTLALARGKKLHDKRETERRREADREIERAVRSAR